jgi:hypothetical protein
MASYQVIFKRLALCAAGCVVLAYATDYLYVRIRMIHPKPADPFESMTTLRVLAIPEKNGKTEYEVDAQNPEQTATCVHSLFPHYGYSPCWYVKPRINQPIPM